MGQKHFKFVGNADFGTFKAGVSDTLATNPFLFLCGL